METSKYFLKYLKYKRKWLVCTRSFEQDGGGLKKRPSPSTSATKFKLGTRKKGNDGNFWVIVNNKNGVKRWSKIKENPRASSAVMKAIYDTVIPQLKRLKYNVHVVKEKKSYQKSEQKSIAFVLPKSKKDNIQVEVSTLSDKDIFDLFGVFSHENIVNYVIRKSSKKSTFKSLSLSNKKLPENKVDLFGKEIQVWVDYDTHTGDNDKITYKTIKDTSDILESIFSFATYAERFSSNYGYDGYLIKHHPMNKSLSDFTSFMERYKKNISKNLTSSYFNIDGEDCYVYNINISYISYSYKDYHKGYEYNFSHRGGQVKITKNNFDGKNSKR